MSAHEKMKTGERGLEFGSFGEIDQDALLFAAGGDIFDA